MAAATITNTGSSTIIGNVSLNPGTSITGFPPGVVTGTTHINDAASTLAKSDLLAAFNFANGLTPAPDKVVGTVDLGTVVIGAHAAGHLPPGVYSSSSVMNVDTNIVLDGGGDPNAVWVFQIGSSLTTTSGNVSMTNSGQAKNVFWVPTASATIGNGTTFSGNILAGVSITCNTGAIISGRLLAGAIDITGAVTLDTNAITAPLP
jgi:hypothetical protein